MFDSASIAFAIVAAGGGVIDANAALEQMFGYTVEADLVISDIATPERNGFDLIRTLRRSEWEGLPVVAMTAFGREEEIEQIRRAGFDEYVRKPVDPRELAAVTATVAKRRVAVGTPRG